jgi:hypothetical protein
MEGLMRWLCLAAGLALSACAAEPLPPKTMTYDGSYDGPVTLLKGGSSCPIPDPKGFVFEIKNGRAVHGWPFIPNDRNTRDGMVMPDGTLFMTGRAYQGDMRVQGQIQDGVYNATASRGYMTDCVYVWHLAKQ